MKKVIFGGFCMVAGALLLQAAAADIGDFTMPAFIVSIAALVYGAVLGISGMKEDK